MAFKVKCVVPSKYSRYDWPEYCQVVPRSGESVQAAGKDAPKLVIREVVFARRQKMIQPPESEDIIELHCEEMPLLG